MIINFFLLLFKHTTAVAPVTEPATDLATKCDPSTCVLPYCFCSRDGTKIPGDLDPHDVSTI